MRRAPGGLAVLFDSDWDNNNRDASRVRFSLQLPDRIDSVGVGPVSCGAERRRRHRPDGALLDRGRSDRQDAPSDDAESSFRRFERNLAVVGDGDERSDRCDAWARDGRAQCPPVAALSQLRAAASVVGSAGHFHGAEVAAQTAAVAVQIVNAGPAAVRCCRKPLRLFLLSRSCCRGG